MSVAPTRAVTVPVSLSWQPRMIKVWLEPFWTICSWGPGVTRAPLRSQVTWASGVETSHWNVASSPSWTVRGVSSETSLTGGGSGRRGEAVNWIPLSPLLICSLGLSPHSPTNYYSLREILLCVVHGDSPKDQDNNSLVSSLQSQPGTSSQVSRTNTSFTMALLQHLTVTETYLLFQFRVWAQRSKTTWLMSHNSQRAESGLDPGQADSRGPVLLYWAIQHARVLERGVGSLRVMSCTHWWEPQTVGWVRCRGEEPRTGGGLCGCQKPVGARGALLPSTLTMKTRLSWGTSHRYSPASPLRAPRTRSTCLAPACSSCTRPWFTRRSPSLYQRTGPPGLEKCTTSSRSPPGVLRTLVWAASGATTRTGGSVGSELGVTGRATRRVGRQTGGTGQGDKCGNKFFQGSGGVPGTGCY